MAIDRADWYWDYSEKNYREDNGIDGELTPEQADEIWLLAADHIGWFLRWIIDRGFEGEEADPERCEKVRSGQITGAEYVMEDLDGKFIDEDVREDVLPFVKNYYYAETGAYLDDLHKSVRDGKPDYTLLKDKIDAAYEQFLKEGVTTAQKPEEEPSKAQKSPMKLWLRILLIVLSVLILAADVIWFMACVFASGQLYNSYNMLQFFVDAPLAAVTIIVPLALAVFLFVLAVRKRK